MTQIDLKEDVINIIKFLDLVKVDRDNFLYATKKLSKLEIKKRGSINVNYKEMQYKKAKLEIFSPRNTNNKNAIYVVHGGAYLHGLTNVYRQFARFILENTKKYDVILLDYDTLPEARYPIANDQTYDGLEYVMANYEKVNVLGDSAGANLALSTMIKRNENNEKLVNTIVLYSPFLDISFSLSSREKNKNRDILIGSKNKNYKFPKLLKENDYYENVEDKKNFYISPVFYDKFENFPPTYIEVGTNEVLYDDSLILAKKLPRVKLVGVNGLFHDFQILLFISTARESVLRTLEFLDRYN